MQVRSLKLGLFGFVLAVVMAAPAQAQSVAVGIGSLDGAFGVVVDGSKPMKQTASGRALSLVGDFGWYSESAVNFLSLGGGLRAHGKIDDKLSWHGQGIVGILRTSLDGGIGDLCDAVGVSCSGTDLYVAPGVGVEYALDAKKALKAQLDIFISDGSGARFWFGMAFKLGQ